MSDLYVKIQGDHIIEAPENYNGIMNYNLDVELMIADGWKILIPVVIPEDIDRLFHIEYRENPNNIEEIIVWDETEEEAEARNAADRKRNKTNEINNKITELNIMLINELRKGNKENIDVYNEVISGLEETRDNL